MAKWDDADAVLDLKVYSLQEKECWYLMDKKAYTFKFHIKTHNVQELLKQESKFTANGGT